MNDTFVGYPFTSPWESNKISDCFNQNIIKIPRSSHIITKHNQPIYKRENKMFVLRDRLFANEVISFQ